MQLLWTRSIWTFEYHRSRANYTFRSSKEYWHISKFRKIFLVWHILENGAPVFTANVNIATVRNVFGLWRYVMHNHDLTIENLWWRITNRSPYPRINLSISTPPKFGHSTYHWVFLSQSRWLNFEITHMAVDGVVNCCQLTGKWRCMVCSPVNMTHFQ